MRAVFVVGHPRSGTTYLSRLLSTCEDVFYIEESGFAGKIDYDKLDEEMHRGLFLRQIAIGKQFQAEDYPKGVFNVLHHYLKEGVTPDEDSLQYDSIKNSRKWLKTVVREAAQGKVFLEKTPKHYLHVNTLEEMFPNSEVFFIVRHPLDMLSSYKEWHKRHWGDTPSLHSTATGWNISVQKMLDHELHWITYEQLVGSPDVFWDIVDCLGLVPTDRTRAMYEECKQITNTWNERLTAEEVEVYSEIIDWDKAALFGYERS